MINTYNESNLHNTLKMIYAAEFNGQTEQKLGPYICDILTETGDVIEIQTSNISALTKKVEYLLSLGKKIKIVHPVIESKTIETWSSDGKMISKRKSPSSDTIYTSLRGLTKIYPYLTDNNLTLEVIGVSVTEIRRKTENKVQNFSKTRRHLKQWISQGKRLESINTRKRYKTKKDYLELIPEDLRNTFTPPQLFAGLLNQNWPDGFSKLNKTRSAIQYTLLIWLLEKMDIIEKTDKKEGRSWIYSVK